MNKTTNDFSRRNIAIDIFRALTMLLMIFVNDLWTVSEIPTWLGHASRDQDFMGLADIVFPCFLFVVGMSIPFAIEGRFNKGLSGVSTVGHIFTRTLALLLMGVFIVNTEYGVSTLTGINLPIYRILMITGFFLVWNVYPKTTQPGRIYLYRTLKWAGIILLIYLAVIFRDNEGGTFSARWWGILGLIGWTYLLCAMIYIFTRDRLKYIIPIWLLFIFLCMIKSGMRNGEFIINFPPDNLPDEFLNILHMGNGSLPAFTMGGIILSLLSTKYADVANGRKVLFAIVTTGMLLLAGIVSHQYWIVSKLQATPPWVFYCSAISVGTYAIVYYLVEKGKAFWFDLITPAGTATLTCYVIPYVTYSISSLLGIQLPVFFTTGFVGLLNCILFSFMIIGITWAIGRLHIKLKI